MVKSPDKGLPATTPMGTSVFLASTDMSARSGLVQCRDAVAWDAFHKSSPHGTPFVLDWYLNNVCPEATRWFWYADGVPVAAAVVPIQDGEPISDPPFSAHQGIAISAEVMKLPTHRRFSRVLEIVDSLLNALSKQNERLHFSFHPYFDDLRGVLWFNYHALEKGRFEISLKYTARLCIHPEDTREAWISASSHGRKYDYKKSERCGLSISDFSDLKTFENLYRLTFERQNISPPSSQIEIIKKVAAQVMISDCGFIIAARSPAGAVASVMLILIDCKCGYNLVMANNPEFRDLGANTRLVIEAIERCQRLGIREFDFVGINSLQRGDFKLSVSAKPKQYIEATWARPNVQ